MRDAATTRQLNHDRSTTQRWRVVAALVAMLALVAAACGDDDADTNAGDGDAASSDAASGDSDSDGDDEMVNACPEDGCSITITNVATEGEELRVQWETNFGPDVARNHVHIYWDNFEPDQVSGDAVNRGVEQGSWVPTGEATEFLTEGAVSVGERGESTTLCVTAADREHAVLDAAIEHCFDVSDVLPS